MNFQCIVDSVIQRNAFLAYSENILLSMLTDNRVAIRELANRRLIAARKEHSSSSKMRQFSVPTLKFDVADYTNLVMWQSIDRCEPPLTNFLTDNELQTYVTTKDFTKAQFPLFPCHTQATERCIRLVTQAAVCGEERRDGFIRGRCAFLSVANIVQLSKHRSH